jgi:hypothetical protein
MLHEESGAGSGMMDGEVEMTKWTASWLAIAALALPPVSEATIGSPSSDSAPLGTNAAEAIPHVQGVFRGNDLFREIDDPHSGAVWLLFRDSEHAGGPGRLVLAAQQSHTRSGAAKGRAPIAESQPVIRPGDALIVEEHTAMVDARLEAIALGSAERDAQFKARLKIGGKVVRVTALGPGRAMLAPEDKGSQ